MSGLLRRCGRAVVGGVSLNYREPANFVRCIFSDSPLPYTIAVTFVSLYALAMTVYSWVSSGYGGRFLIWLTYWAYIVLTLRFLLTARNAWGAYLRTRGIKIAVPWGSNRQQGANLEKGLEVMREMPLLYKAQWILQNVSGCSALMVSGLYWIVLFNPDKVESPRSINSHAINSLLVVGDVLVSRAPVRFLHVLHAVLFVTLYFLFALLYWVAGGVNHLGQPYIYKLFDFDNRPGRAVLVFSGVALIAIPLLQLILYALFRVRLFLFWKWKKPAGSYVIDDQTKAGSDTSGEEGGEKVVCLSDPAEMSSKLSAPDDRCCTVGERGDGGGGKGTDEADLEMEELPALRAVRPDFNSNVSCTESTKALLD